MTDKTHAAPAAVARVLLWRPAQMAVYLGSMVVLARLLPPEAFGAFAIAAAVFWFADTALDFGVSAHLIRDPAAELPQATLSAAFGLWCATATLCAAAVAAAGVILLDMGAMPGLGWSLLVVALALPLSPVIRLRETQRLRALDTRVLAWLPTVAALAAVTVSVGGALAGLGAVALTAGLLADRITQAAFLARLGPLVARVRPTRRGWRPFLSFGSAYTATALLPRAADVARLSIVGAVLGAPAVGLLNRAQHIANLNDRIVLEAILPVAMPVMAQSMREGAGAGQVYATKIDYLSALCWPAALAVAVLAEPLVLVLLGPDWTACILPVQILAIGGLTYPVNRMSAKFFALIGMERTMLRIQAVQQGVLIALVTLGAAVSLAAVCAGVVTAQAAKAAQVSAALHRAGIHDRAALLGATGRGAAITACTIAGPLAAMIAYGDTAWLALCAGIGGGAAGWTMGLVLTRHRLGEQIGGVVRRRMGRAA